MKRFDESFINENAINAIKSIFGIFDKKQRIELVLSTNGSFGLYELLKDLFFTSCSK
jgi:hypothetical protein